jgi:hypothetical protein
VSKLDWRMFPSRLGELLEIRRGPEDSGCWYTDNGNSGATRLLGPPAATCAQLGAGASDPGVIGGKSMSF